MNTNVSLVQMIPNIVENYVEIYSNGIALEKESNKITIRSSDLFFLMFLLRDRFFPTFIQELL